MNRRSLLCSLIALAATLPAVAAPPVSENVIFHARLDEHSQYSDIWGYTDPGGDEYALLCTSMGLAVINITDRKNPYETGFLPGPISAWRDVKTYSHYAYVTNETGSGLAIIDLTDPENPVALPNYSGFSTAHNLYIDTTTARAYIAGSNLGVGGVRILSLANPAAPASVGSWETTYFHDVYVQGDRLYGAAINAARLYVLDVTNPASVTTLGSVGSYPNAFTHNVWANAAGTHVMTTDEVTGAACRVWDVTNPASISQTDIYLPNPATIPHNTQVDGDIAYISHYTIGVRIVDMSNPNNLQELGWYDTYTPDDAGTYRGCWGAFPFFPNSPGLFVASDFTEGLYVLEYKGPLGTVSGAAMSGGSGVSGATVTIQETGSFDVTPLDGSGTFAIEDAPGTVTLEATAFGYLPGSAGATITAGGTTVQDVALAALPGATVSGNVTRTSGTFADGIVEVLGTPVARPLAASSPAAYATDNLPVGTYSVQARAFGLNAARRTVGIVDGVDATADFALNPAPVAETFQTSTAGWTVSGTASAGVWERAAPVATSDYLGPVQTGADHTTGTGECWVTGHLGGAAGANDVDGGTTILTTPVYDLGSMSEPHVSYWRWYSTGVLFTPTTDFFVVDVSSDGGSSWTNLERTDLPQVAWVNVDVDVAALVTPTSQIRFRFTAQDTGAGSVTEAALDDFMIYDVESDATDAPAVGVAGAGEMLLSGAFPNPVVGGAGAAVALSLPERGRVTARIFDVAGRRIATVEDGVLPAGRHRIEWDARGPDGSLVPSGVYFLRLEAEGRSLARKVHVIR